MLNRGPEYEWKVRLTFFSWLAHSPYLRMSNMCPFYGACVCGITMGVSPFDGCISCTVEKGQTNLSTHSGNSPRDTTQAVICVVSTLFAKTQNQIFTVKTTLSHSYSTLLLLSHFTQHLHGSFPERELIIFSSHTHENPQTSSCFFLCVGNFDNSHSSRENCVCVYSLPFWQEKNPFHIFIILVWFFSTKIINLCDYTPSSFIMGNSKHKQYIPLILFLSFLLFLPKKTAMPFFVSFHINVWHLTVCACEDWQQGCLERGQKKKELWVMCQGDLFFSVQYTFFALYLAKVVLT